MRNTFHLYLRRSYDIAGYSFQADEYCPGCILSVMRANGLPVAPVLDTCTTEAALSSVAADLGIDNEDERSYDSGDFPKVIFADSLGEGEYPDICGGCGESL